MKHCEKCGEWILRIEKDQKEIVCKCGNKIKYSSSTIRAPLDGGDGRAWSSDKQFLLDSK